MAVSAVSLVVGIAGTASSQSKQREAQRENKKAKKREAIEQKRANLKSKRNLLRKERMSRAQALNIQANEGGDSSTTGGIVSGVSSQTGSGVANIQQSEQADAFISQRLRAGAAATGVANTAQTVGNFGFSTASATGFWEKAAAVGAKGTVNPNVKSDDITDTD